MKKNTNKTVGKYEIISKIGQGGMSTVYKAKHPTLNRHVLLKKLTLRGGSQFIERFKREARIMMDFKHDHIVHVYDHFKEGSSYYIVEEFVDGLSLDELSRRERYLSNDAAMLLLYEMCKALKYAHDQLVVHRDIKPGNILISHDGEVKLVDFGIATSLGEVEEGLTRTGMTLGTPSYIPPEQIDDAKSVDKRADIYALGVVLYEMLTGKTPFPGTFTAETIALIHRGKYPAPQRFNPKIARVLRRIIRKSMKPRRSRRFKDLKVIIRLLERRIRRRDKKSIKSAVKKVLQGKSIRELYTKRSGWLVGLFCVAAACLLAIGGFIGFRRGFLYEFYRADRTGAMTVAASIPAGYKDPTRIYIEAVLYRVEAGELVRLDLDFDFGRASPESSIWDRLRPDRDRRSQPDRNNAEEAAAAESAHTVLESKKLYLSAGAYRLKVSLEGSLYWSSFFLNPRTVQRQRFDTRSGRRIELELEASASLPLEVRYTAFDIATGEDLTGGTGLFVFQNERWVLLNKIRAGNLKTNRGYRFQFRHTGFYPQVYSLRIQPYQSLLRLQAHLIPVEGLLVFSSQAERLTVLLNDSTEYLSGGMVRQIETLEPLTVETRTLSLDPGVYRVTVEKDADLTRTVEVEVLSDQTVRINVAFDPQSDRLEVLVE